MKQGGVHLAAAGKFRFHEPGCSGANVAFGASHAGVRRELISRVFRTHHRVAELPAELNRLGELIGFVTSGRTYNREDHQKAYERNDGAPLAWIIEINFRIKGR